MPDQRDAAIQRYWPLALKKQQESGIPASVFLSILGTESNWGNTPGNALFGFQGVQGTAGTVTLNTQAGPRVFAAYQTPEDAFDAFIRLMQVDRYKDAWANRADPAKFFAGLQRGGYAGDASFEDRNWSNLQTSVVKDVQARAQRLGVQTMTTPATSTSTNQRRYVFPVYGYQDAVADHWGEVKGGSDLFAQRGTPVLAMTDGVVVSAGYGDVGGNNITIQGDDGLTYYYAHLDDVPLVKQGQRVGAGVQLGGVGDSGNAKGKGYHLHLGIGPTIRNGADKYGGTGGDYDAISLLRSVQSGQQPTAQGGAGGGQSRPATGGAAMSSPQSTGTSIPPEYQAAINAEVENYNRLIEEQRTLQQSLASLSKDPPKDEQGNVRKDADQFALPSPFDEAASRLKAIETEKSEITKRISALQLAENRGSDPGVTAQGQAALRNADREDATAAYNAAMNQITTPYDIAAKQAGLQTTGSNMFTAAINGLNTLAQMRQILFGQNESIGKLWDTLFNSEFTRFYNGERLKLDKGEQDLNGFATAINEGATMLTQQAAWAANNLAMSKYVSDENWRRAQMLLPAGTEYQPGMGPNDLMAQGVRAVGGNPTVIKTQALPEGWNDPWSNIRKAGAVHTEMGYGAPTQLMGQTYMDVVAQANRNAATPLDTFKPSDQLGSMPALPKPSSTTDLESQATDALTDFLAGKYTPKVPELKLPTWDDAAGASPIAPPSTTPPQTGATRKAADGSEEIWDGTGWKKRMVPPAPNPATSANPQPYAQGGQVPAMADGGQQSGTPQWGWNATRRRWEGRLYDAATGQWRIVAAIVDGATDNSDLGPGVAVRAEPLIEGLMGGDPRLAEQARAAFEPQIAQRLQQSSQAEGQGQGYGGVRMDPRDIMAQVQRMNSGLDVRAANTALQQAEYELQQKMRAAGQDPAYWFGQYAQPQGQTGPGGEQVGPNVLLDPAYVQAYTAQDVAGHRALLMSRTERLQQIGNAFAAHMAGAERLQTYGDTRRARDQAAAQYALDEQRLNADPSQDKNQRPLANGQWTHAQNMGAAQAIQGADQQLDQLLQQYDPAGYQFEQEQRRKQQQGGWLPEQVRQQMYPASPYAKGGQVAEDDPNLLPPWLGMTPTQRVAWMTNDSAGAGFMPGGITPLYQQLAATTPAPMAQGGQVPAFEQGGGYGYLSGAASAYGGGYGASGQNYQTYQGNPDGGLQGQNTLAQDQEIYRKQALGNELESQDVANQIAQLDAAKQTKMGEMYAAAQQRIQAIRAQYPIAQQEADRRLNNIAQQRGALTGEAIMQPFAARGGQPFTM